MSIKKEKTKEEVAADILNGIYNDYKLPMLTEEQNTTLILSLLMDRPELIRKT